MRKLRLIQCGVSNYGRLWLTEHTTPSPDFDLVAIVDPDADHLDASGEAAGVPPARRFTSLEAAHDGLAAEGDEADAVLTITPPVVHAEHARLAFSRGLHLLTEKPLADSIEHARQMVRLAAESDLQLAVCQNYRYRPPIQKMRQLVQDETYGPLGHGHIDFYIPIDFGDSFRNTMQYPFLFDMAIHHMDLIRYVTGRNITRVMAQSFNPTWSWIKHHAALKLLLELEGGLPFSYSGDWSAYGRSTSWNGRWRLQCAEASIHLDDDAITVGTCGRWDEDPTLYKIRPEDMTLTDRDAILHRFAQAIRSGQPAETSGADNLYSFGAIIAGMISAQEERFVEVSEVLDG
jgi:predicted dehydrogenase